MTVAEKAPTTAREEALHRVTVIRNALEVADEELCKAFAARDWETLGYRSWAEYCAKELPELRMVKLRTGPRRERVAKLLEAGASVRELAAATGASVGSVHNDVAVIEQRAPRPQVFSSERAWEVATRHVRAAGELTCLEFENRSGWRHGAASAALHAAERKGHVRRVPVFRQGYAAYVPT